MSDRIHFQETLLQQKLSEVRAPEEQLSNIIRTNFPHGYEYGPDGKLYIHPWRAPKPDIVQQHTLPVHQEMGFLRRSRYPDSWDEIAILSEDGDQISSL